MHAADKAEALAEILVEYGVGDGDVLTRACRAIQEIPLMLTLLAPSISRQWRHSLLSVECSATYSDLRIWKMTLAAPAPWMETFWEVMLSILSSGA
jgi:hypothetical protein